MKKMYYFCKIFVALKTRRTLMFYTSACIILLSACNDALTPKEETQVRSDKKLHRVMSIDEFPSSSPEALTGPIQQEPDIVCPAKAYVVATYELENGKYNMFKRLQTETLYDENQIGEYHVEPEDTSWHLTEYPRMIFDFDGRVKYYEYGLVENNEITGIITVHARKEAPQAIAYMFPYVLPYDNADYDYYVGEYPCRVFNDGEGYRAVEDCETNPYLEYPLQVFEDGLYDQLEPDEIDQLNEMRNQGTIVDSEYEAEANAYWETIDNLWIALDYDLPCVYDGHSGGTPITISGNTYVQSLRSYLGTSDFCFDYTAVPYRSTPLQKTYWSGACAPAALAWIYRGLYDEYPPIGGDYLPIHGDSPRPYFGVNNYGISLYYYGLGYVENWCSTSYNAVRDEYIQRSLEVDNGLTAKFYEQSHFVMTCSGWQSYILPWRLGNAFSAATNNVYTVAGDCSATTAADNIYHNNLPVLLLVATGCFWDHYLIAYGYGGITTSGHNVERKNLYFLIMDNGHTISKHHYKPYWRAYKSCEFYYRVMRN